MFGEPRDLSIYSQKERGPIQDQKDMLLIHMRMKRIFPYPRSIAMDPQGSEICLCQQSSSMALTDKLGL